MFFEVKMQEDTSRECDCKLNCEEEHKYRNENQAKKKQGRAEDI